MAASEGYKQRLAEWASKEVERHGSLYKFTIRLCSAADAEVSVEQVRKWVIGKYVKELDSDMLLILAAYRNEPMESTRIWLEGDSDRINAEIHRAMIDRIDDPHQLLQIQYWILERIGQLLKADRPKTLQEIRDWLRENQEFVSKKSEVPIDRVRTIADGDQPTMKELAMLANCWDGDVDWLASFFDADPELGLDSDAPEPKKKRTSKRSASHSV
jgi:hypothetical protein